MPGRTATQGVAPFSFENALHADQPAPDRAEKLALYGRFIGSWAIKGTVRGQKANGGQVHFGWVLGGRAIQDVWILPDIFHGTTLRVFDPGLDAWHILWSDPLQQYYSRQIGRADGNRIVQIGTNDAGQATRWSFDDISRDSFVWRGELSTDGGASWELEAIFNAVRVA